MSRRKLKAGSTSQTVPVFVQDTSSTTGAGLGSLVFNTSGLAAKYRREGQSAWTTITLATATVGTWTSGGFISDGGPVTGGYEVGIPDAVLAAGVKWAEVVIYGAANMLPVLLEFELDTIDYQASGGKVPVQQLVAGDFAANSLNGKGDWLLSSGYTAPLDAAGTRAAVGLGSANLDTQLAAKQATFTSATGVTFPTNFGVLAINGFGRVDLGSIRGSTLGPAVTGGDYGGAFASLFGAASADAPGVNAAALLATVLTQRNVSSLTTSTVEDALSAARAQGAGAWTLVGTTLTLKNPNGTTFRIFTIDSAPAPTSRT